MPFKITPALCAKTIEELRAMSSFDLVSITRSRQPTNIPENFFSFLKYRATTILADRDDRHEAAREYESRLANRKLAGAVRNLVRAVPDIATEKWFIEGVGIFLNGKR